MWVLWTTLVGGLIVGCVQSAQIQNTKLGAHSRHPIAINNIQSIESVCTADRFNITIVMDNQFKGMLFAKDFANTCKSVGVAGNSISISLPTSGCGVRLTTNSSGMSFGVVVVLQQDKHLKQITDKETLVVCRISEDQLEINSHTPLMQEFVREHHVTPLQNMPNSRRGRTSLDERIPHEMAKAWMEIVPDARTTTSSLKVGEPSMLLFKATLPIGIGWRVLDCIAHDGLGDSSQMLLDGNGCPIDELILPAPESTTIRLFPFMKHEELMSRFAAFKFPDRDRLHVACGIQLCKGNCSDFDCSVKDNRISRQLGNNSNHLDRLEVYNSAEVVAPAIDDLNNKLENEFPYISLPGDRPFCVSLDKLAITFCILGVVFLSTVLIAFCVLVRKRTGAPFRGFYGNSIFSSSCDSSSFGSKLLLLRDSPNLRHGTKIPSATNSNRSGIACATRDVGYGRII